MASTSAARGVVASMGTRAVHIKIYPRTRNMRESRQILRLLKRYGPVLSFRNMQYDSRDAVSPHLIYAIFQESEAATNFVNASPMKFIIDPPPPERPVVSPALSEFADAMAKAGHPIEQYQSPLKQPEEPREFSLTAQLSVGYDHVKYIQHQAPYWGYDRPALRTIPQWQLYEPSPVRGMEDVSPHVSTLPPRVVWSKMREVHEQKPLSEQYEEALQQHQTQQNTTSHPFKTPEG